MALRKSASTTLSSTFTRGLKWFRTATRRNAPEPESHPTLSLFPELNLAKQTSVIFSILATIEPSLNVDSNTMVLDYLMILTELLATSACDLSRFQHLEVQDIRPYFPDKTFTCSEAGCDPVVWPLPACFTHTEATMGYASVNKFVAYFPHRLRDAATSVREGETFVIVLVGQGAMHQDLFFLCVTSTGRSNRKEEVRISKTELEYAVKDCKGRIVVVANPCYSDALQSPLWILCCAGKALIQLRSEHIADAPTIRAQLDVLAPGYADLDDSFYWSEGRDCELCRHYLIDPSSVADDTARALVLRLRSRNAQAVAMQCVANKLGWVANMQTVPYFALRLGKMVGAAEAFRELCERVDIHEIYEELRDSFVGLGLPWDRASLLWLAKQWVEAGRVEVAGEDWKHAIVSGVEDAKGLVLVPGRDEVT
ncbi:hypothetical protein HMN09_00333400 [Mycena chlorophos]|uniref:Uncharacterized protein n=1 Tax=Mycena chlorophos TaxID=658473 RepID=A0A8H6WMY6_MYCCL|nr:hypothetical protein HMN09_00333400 [Mycena chlorophos]